MLFPLNHLVRSSLISIHNTFPTYPVFRCPQRNTIQAQDASFLCCYLPTSSSVFLYFLFHSQAPKHFFTVAEDHEMWSHHLSFHFFVTMIRRVLSTPVFSTNHGPYRKCSEIKARIQSNIAHLTQHMKS